MTTTNTKIEYTIDATDKSVGRVASEAAKILMGKNTAAYQRNQAPEVTVTIDHASKANVHFKKFTQRAHKSFSGYPGGLSELKWKDVIAKKGYSELFRKAVYGMLPGNRLRNGMMKRLRINEE